MAGAGTPKRRPANAAPHERRLVEGGNDEGGDCQRGGKHGASRRADVVTR